MPEMGDALPPEQLARVQIIHEVAVHVGAALTTSAGGSEPGVGRTLIAQVTHYRNGTAAGGEAMVTLFGLDEDAARQMLGGMLIGVQLAYGDAVTNEVMDTAAMLLAAHEADAAKE